MEANFKKFEDVWQAIWEYIYAILKYFKVEPFYTEEDAAE